MFVTDQQLLPGFLLAHIRLFSSSQLLKDLRLDFTSKIETIGK